MQQFGAFLDDRQVGGEVGVEDGVEAESPQGGGHLAGDQRAGRVAETLAQRRANGRRGLDDDMLVRIVERLPDLVDLVLFGDRTDRTDGGTLAALDAGHGAQVAVERRTDRRVETTPLRPQGADMLRLGADAHAAAALDALAVIAHQAGRRGVDPLARLLRPGYVIVADAQLGRQRLQLAVLAAIAGLAVAVVLGQQQFDDQPARFADAARVGADLHAFGDRHRAGGDQVLHAFDFHDADAAGTDRLQPLDVAERGDADARLPRGMENRRALGDFDRHIVDRQLDHACLGSVCSIVIMETLFAERPSSAAATSFASELRCS